MIISVILWPITPDMSPVSPRGRWLVSRWTEQGRLIFVFLMTLIAPDMGITNGHQSKTQIVGKVILKSFKYKVSQTIPAFRFGLVFREHI